MAKETPASASTVKAARATVLKQVFYKRLASVVVFALFLIFVSIVISRQNKESMIGFQVDQFYEKEKQCYADSECPEGTYCDAKGMCVGTIVKPTLRASQVLGRGRAAEGDTLRVSTQTQGQN